MSIKAGRVGVAPDQVDEFGHISSEATSGYTKQEADAKFETQLHAASTYETKSEAEALQPKTLAVPIEMLSGSKLTVEDALQGLNSEKFDRAEQAVLGAKNLFENKANSQTTGGLTFTVNNDGSVTVNGTCNPDTGNWVTFVLASQNLNKETVTRMAGKDIIFTDYHTTVRKLQFYCESLGNILAGNRFTIPSNIASQSFNIVIQIQKNEVLSNETFYPMFRLASDPDDTYAPYAMTNRELTENKLDTATLKSITADAADFAAFKTAIANL